MRINDASGINSTQAVDRIAAGAARGANRPPVEAAADSADVTAVAERAQGADAHRLEALRTAVESGQYHVSAENVAESIISAHLKP